MVVFLTYHCQKKGCEIGSHTSFPYLPSVSLVALKSESRVLAGHHCLLGMNPVPPMGDHQFLMLMGPRGRGGECCMSPLVRVVSV